MKLTPFGLLIVACLIGIGTAISCYNCQSEKVGGCNRGDFDDVASSKEQGCAVCVMDWAKIEAYGDVIWTGTNRTCAAECYETEFTIQPDDWFYWSRRCCKTDLCNEAIRGNVISQTILWSALTIGWALLPRY